jgi:hypothetical protein
MTHLRVHLGFTTASDTSTLETGQAVHVHLYTSTAWVVPPNPAIPVTAAALSTAVENFSSAIAAAQMGGHGGQEQQTGGSRRAAATVGRHFRRVDGKRAMKEVHQELKHFLEQTDVTNS